MVKDTDSTFWQVWGLETEQSVCRLTWNLVKLVMGDGMRSDSVPPEGQGFSQPADSSLTLQGLQSQLAE